MISKQGMLFQIRVLSQINFVTMSFHFLSLSILYSRRIRCKALVISVLRNLISFMNSGVKTDFFSGEKNIS